MMISRLLMDVLPYDPDRERRIREIHEKIANDTIDTLNVVSQQVGDGVSSGGGSHSTPYILGAILAALVALGFLIFMVRSYRERNEQQLSFTRS